MPLAPLFNVFREGINRSFAKAKSEAGPSVSRIDLVIEEEPIALSKVRAQFAVLMPAGPVRIT